MESTRSHAFLNRKILPTSPPRHTIQNTATYVGNTVIVIEHNLDVIKSADYLIDLGPEGGSGGGQIIATGTPEDIASNPASFTGQYLRPVLGQEALTAY